MIMDIDPKYMPFIKLNPNGDGMIIDTEKAINEIGKDETYTFKKTINNINSEYKKQYGEELFVI